jgi:prephenate dehydrogenase
MTTQITILGLGQFGTSIGLALATQKDQILRVGNDREASISRQAEKMGAFDKTIINLHNAVENAAVVILCLPVDEIEETVKTIVDDLQPGTVVIDTSPLKVPVTEMITKLLGPDRYFVTLSSSLNPAYLEEAADGPQAAHADLFKNSLMVITSNPGVPAGAIQLASDLAALLGGTPLYADPYEADGLMAASDTLPKLIAAALVHAAMDQPGWREGRKLAGKHFALSTTPVTGLNESKHYGTTAILNHENVVRVLDNAIDSLMTIRGMVERQETDALHEYLSQAQNNRATWLDQRVNSKWDAAAQQAVPTAGDFLGRLVGLRPKDKSKK